MKRSSIVNDIYVEIHTNPLVMLKCDWLDYAPVNYY